VLLTVTKNNLPVNVELNTPPGIHNVFHADRLRLCPHNPLPGQMSDDVQPEGIVVNDNVEHPVHSIVGETRHKDGRPKQYLVQWVGYVMCSWEPAAELQNNAALDKWEEFSAEFRVNRVLPVGF
jgi:hypothetical protein